MWRRLTGDAAIAHQRWCSYNVAMARSARKRAKSTERAVKQRKKDVVRFRVTDEQKQVLVQAAEKEGLDVSAWLRQLSLRAAGALPEREE